MSDDPWRALQKKKSEKERDMMRTFGDNYVRVFDELNLEYQLIHRKKATVVAVHIKDNKWVEFRIVPNNSQQYIDQLLKIPERVEAIKALFDTFDGEITIVKKSVV